MGKKRVAGSTSEEALKESSQQEDTLDKQKSKNKKKSRVLNRANFYIKTSYNNVMITVTDEEGNVLSWATSGLAGFKGPRKATPYAASKVTELVMNKMEKVDMQGIHILVNGIGSARDAAIRALVGRGLNVVAIKDITPVPHNGCRPKKPRRV